MKLDISETYPPDPGTKTLRSMDEWISIVGPINVMSFNIQGFTKATKCCPYYEKVATNVGRQLTID